MLKWQYSRSSYVDAGHPPYNSVWIDDVDLPGWNTQPTVPRLIAPANGQVVSATGPVFTWRSADADFDRIIYEVQYDSAPAFSAPVSTGETSELTFTPVSDLASGTTYYWRARAKDVKDHRWGAWSPVSAFTVDSAVQAGLWRQRSGPEFALDALAGTQVAGNAVEVTSQLFTKTDAFPQQNAFTLSMTATGLPPAKPGTAARLQVFGCMTCTTAYCTKFVNLDGGQLGQLYTGSGNSSDCRPVTAESSVYTIPNFQTYIASDAAVTLDLSRVGAYAGYVSNFSYSLSYDALGAGTVTSVPISLDAFGAGRNWDGLSVDADAGTTVQILDRNQNLVPESAIPGNAAGLPPGSVKLWNLDAGQYPLIYLRATVHVTQQIRRWEVSVNTGYRWDFAHAGDAEGWQALLTGATPTTAVTGGVLRMDAPAAGTDPRLVYQLPGEVDATRFRTTTVRLRTSNNSDNDTVTLYWQNNFGLFDAVRTFASTAFLFQQTEVSFDLTQIPAAPNQPWQGRINALRLDPVQRFFDAVGAATNGWVEVDSIWLR